MDRDHVEEKLLQLLAGGGGGGAGGGAGAGDGGGAGSRGAGGALGAVLAACGRLQEAPPWSDYDVGEQASAGSSTAPPPP